MEAAVGPALFLSLSHYSSLHRSGPGFLLPSRLALLALGFRLGPAPRLFNFALDVHTSDTRTLPLSLKANPVRECSARVRTRASAVAASS
jgi:hypothetical protein